MSVDLEEGSSTLRIISSAGFICNSLLYIYIYIYIYIYSLLCVCIYIYIYLPTEIGFVIAAENSTAGEGHKSTRRAGANNVILLLENVNRMNQDYSHSIHEPIVEHQCPGDIPCKPRI